MRSKAVTIVLALLLGVTGLHRFYLGDNYSGGAYLAGFMICLVLMFFGMGSWSLAMLGTIALVDAINFMSMSSQAFHHEFDHIKI